MDIVSIELGIALLLLFVAPVAYILLKQSGKEKRTLKQVEALCGKQHFRLDAYEIINNLFIGVDKQNKYLVYANLPINESSVHLVPTKKIKSVEAVKKEVPKPGQANAKTIESVILELHFNDNSPKKTFVFFDADVGTDPHISFNDAKKWETQITSCF